MVALATAGCGMRPAMAEGDALRAGPYDPLIAKFVQLTLTRQHIATPELNDEVSERWLANYLDAIDPQHWYFLASDIEEFQAKYGKTLDDDLRGEPRLEAAFEIFTRLQQRMQERLGAARELADQQHDFTVDETYVFDRRDASWPESVAAADDLWRRYVKNEIIAGKLSEKEDTETLELLRKRWDRIEKNTLEMEAVEVRELYLNALTTTFDPHSNYMRPANAEDFQIDLSNQLEGIGAVLSFDDGYTKVTEVVKGGPAAKSGQLAKDDRIVAVAQGKGDPVDIVEMRLDKVVKMIRGPKGSEVHLTVIPAGADAAERKIVTIVRDKVEIADRVAKATVHDLKHDDHTYKLGVINLPTFYTPHGPGGGPDASEDVKRLLNELKAQDVDGVVFDLRENGGGSLTEAVEIGGLFVEDGPMVQVHSPVFMAPEVLRDPDNKVVYDGPLVVLTSPLSASASEIVAGAVQDYGRGLVVGSKTTHGKGTVQTLVPLDGFLQDKIGRRLREPIAGNMKLTTQKFYRVSGESTQFKGVLADIVLPSEWDGRDIYESDLENALPWDEITATRYRRIGDYSDIVPELAKRSAVRVASDAEFAKILDRVAYVVGQKDRKEATLVLADRLKENEEFKARFGDDDDEPEVTEAKPDTGPDPVQDETLRITADFIQLQKS